MRRREFINDNIVKITSEEAYRYYRENSKIRKPSKFKDSRDFKKVIRSIFQKASIYGLQYSGGVYLKNFFYFVPIHYPRVSVKSKYLYMSHGFRVYRPIHTPCMGNSFYNSFFFDGGYNDNYSKYYSEYMKNHDPLYKYHYSLLKKLN